MHNPVMPGNLASCNEAVPFNGERVLLSKTLADSIDDCAPMYSDSSCAHARGALGRGGRGLVIMGRGLDALK